MEDLEFIIKSDGLGQAGVFSMRYLYMFAKASFLMEGRKFNTWRKKGRNRTLLSQP